MQVLIVDDCEDDVVLLLHQLRRAGFNPRHTWASSREALLNALRLPGWDLILCDYAMGGFDAWHVLEICRKLEVRAPVIVLSGVVGGYISNRIAGAGARGYVAKGDWDSLASLIRQEIAPTA